MKKTSSTLLIFFLVCPILLFSCFSGSESDNGIPMGGEEDQIAGNWWSDGINDGALFDGAGGGYDLSNDGSGGYCIDIDDPIIYRYDGETLTIYEDGEVTTGTLTNLTENSATFYSEGEYIYLSKVPVSGNCD
jgi:hypothetical protein